MSKTKPAYQTSGFACCVPFGQFPKMRADWKKNNPGAKITEVFTTLGMGQMAVPDPMNIGQTRPEPTIVIYWAIIYQIQVKDHLNNAVAQVNGTQLSIT